MTGLGLGVRIRTERERGESRAQTKLISSGNRHILGFGKEELDGLRLGLGFGLYKGWKG
jgi:hypothetical protein